MGEVFQVSDLDSLPGVRLIEMTDMEAAACAEDIREAPGCYLALHEDHWHLSGLYVPLSLRRCGVGRRVMTAALCWVDKQGLGLPVILDARPYGVQSATAEQLRAFYASFGFERWPLHPSSMYRWPIQLTKNGGKNNG